MAYSGHNLTEAAGIKSGLVLWALFLMVTVKLSGQTCNRIMEELTRAGFENVKCVLREDQCYVSLENNTYRWDAMAVSEALDLIGSEINGQAEINLIILDNGIPQKLVRADYHGMAESDTGMIDPLTFTGRISVSHKTGDAFSELKDLDYANPSVGKIDIRIYPQFYFENTRLDKFYETQLNIAPAVEFSLWKGSTVTGQVIIPVQNSLGHEGDHIRPGIVSISQDLRLSDNFMTSLSAGNFTGNIYGAVSTAGINLIDGDFYLEIMAGLVGSSHFIDDEWIHSRLDRFTSSVSLSWFWSSFNLELKAGGARFVNEDYGLFASALRMFNETSVGLYAQILESGINGGFFFSVPLFCRKRANRKFLRITIPSQYGFTYDAGTEYFYGQLPVLRPNFIYEDRFKWNKAIENMIINLKSKKE